MRSSLKAVALVVGLAVLGIVSASVFIYSGVYNIAADDPHTPPVEALIGNLRNRSIEARAKTIEAALSDDPKRIAAGANQYAEMCVSCHSAPGVAEESEIRKGLYPQPPNLALHGVHDPKQAFWVIKHGIKMSGMPAWGPTHSDETIWNMVSFLQKMPTMSPDEYSKLSAAEEGSGHSHGGHSEHSSASMQNDEKHEMHEEEKSESGQPSHGTKGHSHKGNSAHTHKP